MLGRKKGGGGTAVADGMARCDLCGTTVPVDADGRCDLGHRLSVAPADEPTTAQDDFPLVEAETAETEQTVPPASAEAETPPPLAATPEERSPQAEDDPFFHPYDEVLADEAGLEAEAAETPAAPAEPKAEADEPAPGLAPDELEDLLAWDNDDTDLSVDLAAELGDDTDER